MIHNIKIRRSLTAITVLAVALVIGGTVISVGAMLWAGDRTTVAREPATVTTTLPARQDIPTWMDLADCEDVTEVAPCYTIDQVSGGTALHWIVVLSYHPYRALIMDAMVEQAYRTERAS